MSDIRVLLSFRQQSDTLGVPDGPSKGYYANVAAVPVVGEIFTIRDHDGEPIIKGQVKRVEHLLFTRGEAMEEYVAGAEMIEVSLVEVT